MSLVIDSKTPVASSVDDVSDEPSPTTSRANYLAGRQPVQRKWYAWYADTDSPEERRLIAKMDLLIMSFAVLAYWAKYIDQGNLTNAYVSGMKEDLGFYGNQLVQLQTCFNVAYTVFMIPLTLLAAEYPKIIPACEFMWGIFTLLQYRANSFGELAAYRFMTGLFESSFFTSIHYVLGSWYRTDELGRRAGIFYVATCLGTMTTGFLASGIIRHLDGAHGLAGWRWLYIVCSVLTLPIGIFGFVFFPSTPDKLTDAYRWLTADEKALARERMRRIGGKPAIGFGGGWTLIRRFFYRWHIYVLGFFLVPWILTCQPSGNGAYTLWIKSLGKYSTARLNELTAINPGVGLFFILFYAFLSDQLQTKLPIILFQGVLAFSLQLAFPLWDRSSTAYKWAAVATGYGQNAVAPLLYSWANEICREDAEERAFVVAVMCAMSNVFATWVPLLVWQTVDGPEYHVGYIFTQVFIVVFMIAASFVWWYDKRDQKRITQGLV
ncbi:mfs transporter [Ophiostoma piceae UAMH 11346]|uniref:Mfs transporter n=1 Tax=Ophiostoma piceae (strain UAMH 11346) TaxID=1262450 RepID=S3CPR5_OPHP1|nr:mfs transporter [Ophiostoma piceae UAMH 11346]